jgi:hypothetical protein
MCTLSPVISCGIVYSYGCAEWRNWAALRANCLPLLIKQPHLPWLGWICCRNS